MATIPRNAVPAAVLAAALVLMLAAPLLVGARPDQPTPPTAAAGDGAHLVGVDLVPGRYVTAGAAGRRPCWWQVTDRAGQVLAGGTTTTLAYVPEQPGEQLADGVTLRSAGCLPWEIDGVITR